ncbi:MAG: T9SS type A sorting domain-containing protein [Bacteroidia bacterium]
MRKTIYTLLGFLFAFPALAQENGDTYVPLYSNVQIKKFRAEQSSRPVFYGKTGVKDTLTLPFFDDFSSLGVIPTDTLWSDAAVFINPDFPINPPSIGVATFDGLDALGNAYEGIDVNVFGPADTLSSQPVNLSSFLPGDSIYLSFFYQAQGLSFEALTAKDSLVLQFRNHIGAWVNVWSSPGISLQDFKAVCIPVKDTSFLHSGFRFRWINYQQYIGNLKQWHLDYVYLNQGRNFSDTLFEDQAMVYLPSFPFTDYTYMPWKQLQVNFAKHLKLHYEVPVQNLSNNGETFSISMRVNDLNDEVGAHILNGQSLTANGIDTFILAPGISLFTDTRDSNELRIVTKLGEILGGNNNKQNDSAIRTVELANYYAYDDGTAESGYGIRNSTGSVAYGFELESGDSVRGIWVHFTQAEVPVTGGFSLNLWQKIAAVGQPSSGVDELVYKHKSSSTVYTDSINGFHLFLFDSAVYVSGKFYVGWTQNASYLLNVGLDRNYRYLGQDVPNPNLFYNTNGTWKKASVPGTIMMRPVVGDQWPTPLALPEKPEHAAINLYPNPAERSFKVSSEHLVESVVLYDMKGVLIKKWEGYETEFGVSELPSGVYLVRIFLGSGLSVNKKIIISN